MENILGKKIELLPVQIKDGYIHCSTCSGIGWMLSNQNLVKCRCSSGLTKLCSYCKEPVPYSAGRIWDVCEKESCVQAQEEENDKKEEVYRLTRLSKAQELDTEDELVLNCEMFYSDVYDSYYSSVDDYIIELSDNTIDNEDLNPEDLYLYLCKREELDLDVVGYVEEHVADIHEDAEYQLNDLNELEDFVNKWMEKQDIITYYTDYSKYVGFEIVEDGKG